MVCLPGIRISFKKKKTSRSHTKTTEVPCLICGIPSTISCSVCKTAYYCGDGEHENVRSYAQCQLFVPNSSLSPSPPLRFACRTGSHTKSTAPRSRPLVPILSMRSSSLRKKPNLVSLRFLGRWVKGTDTISLIQTYGSRTKARQ